MSVCKNGKSSLKKGFFFVITIVQVATAVYMACQVLNVLARFSQGMGSRVHRGPSEHAGHRVRGNLRDDYFRSVADEVGVSRDVLRHPHVTLLRLLKFEQKVQ